MYSLSIRWILLQAVFYAVITAESGNFTPIEKVDKGLIPRVENGVMARLGWYKWMIALLKRETIIGSASLITTKTAITGAQLFLNVRHISEVEGRIGHINWRNGQRLDFSEIKVHENYNATRSRCLNDIALLILRDAVTISARIATLTLPRRNLRYYGKVLFAGWGSCVPGVPAQSDVLKYVSWEMYNAYFTAGERATMNPLALRTFLSATSNEKNGPCPGDYGGLWMYGTGRSRKGFAIQTYCVRSESAGEMYIGISTGYYAPWIRSNSVGEVRFVG